MKTLISVTLAFFFLACSDDNKSSAAVSEPVKEVTLKKTEIVEKKAEVVVVKEVVAEIVESPDKVAVAPRTGQTIFAACSACHGADASKQALGKSQVIKGWDSAKVIDALNGYKDGTYGGTMKGIMKGQVSALSAEDIKSVSEYISKL